MSTRKIAIATLTVSIAILVFSNNIAIDPVWETTKISRVVTKDPMGTVTDDQWEPRDDNSMAKGSDKLLIEPHDDVVIKKREPTIVDGTKKAVTKRERFILGAVSQYGLTTSYDGAYRKISYPNGDVDITTGVCTDVIIRAFRAVGIDLQKEIHKDMKRHFRQYPKKWGLKSPDTNIDHRRVPNMETYFERKGYKIPIGKGDNFKNYKPGDLVVWRISGDFTHIGIVSDQKVPGTTRHYIIHNPFQGVEISDWLTEFKIINHFRVFKDKGYK